jgi:hypothetical protein
MNLTVSKGSDEAKTQVKQLKKKIQSEIAGLFKRVVEEMMQTW